jgi:tetratricopeptide (TPR) repeat protein
LSFIPSEWKSLIRKDASSEALTAALAFETGDYPLAWEKISTSINSISDKVLQIEAGKAIGNDKGTLDFVDLEIEQTASFSDVSLTAEIVETMLDAGQIEKAGSFVNKAVETYPEDITLALLESRVLAETGQLNQAEDLLDQALQKLGSDGRFTSAANALTLRNLVKAAEASNRWEEAKQWSGKFLEAQPKNLAAIKIGLEVLVLGLEFFKLVANLAVKKHLHMDDKSIAAMKFELSKILAMPDLAENADLHHL